jgi:hypothetical protein
VSNKPLLLSDNLFENVVLHPTFVVGTDQATLAGREAFRVADNLRDMTSWASSVPNTNQYIWVDALTPVAPNTIVIDRGHNLAGAQVLVRGDTSSAFATAVTIVSCVLPSSPGGLPTDANGCLTPDGVWWKTFTGQSFRAQGIEIIAMGVGIAPIATGIYLGTSYRFPEFLNAPAALDFGTNIKYMRNELSRGGLRSKSRPLNFDKLPLNVHLDSGDYTGFDVEVRRLLRYGQPWWFCLDDSDATLSGLMRCFQTSQDTDFNPQVNPVHREIQLLLEEVLPSLYA